MPDDRKAAANGTLARQQSQWNYPGSRLSFPSGSAIKRIKVGVKALFAELSAKIRSANLSLHPPVKLASNETRISPFPVHGQPSIGTLAALKRQCGSWGLLRSPPKTPLHKGFAMRIQKDRKRSKSFATVSIGRLLQMVWLVPKSSILAINGINQASLSAGFHGRSPWLSLARLGLSGCGSALICDP